MTTSRKNSKRTIALLFSLPAILSICIATDRATYPDDDSWFARNEDQQAFVISYIRVNKYGWPFTTISRYRQRWNGGARCPVVTDELKGILRTQVRKEAYRTRSFGEWDKYKQIVNSFPEESGIRLHWLGFVVNSAAALLAATVLIVIVERMKSITDRQRIRRRQRLGLCARCKYDMRGSIESGRCPECGTLWDSSVPRNTPAQLVN